MAGDLRTAALEACGSISDRAAAIGFIDDAPVDGDVTERGLQRC
jgi:hypothetical protein